MSLAFQASIHMTKTLCLKFADSGNVSGLSRIEMEKDCMRNFSKDGILVCMTQFEQIPEPGSPVKSQSS